MELPPNLIQDSLPSSSSPAEEKIDRRIEEPMVCWTQLLREPAPEGNWRAQLLPLPDDFSPEDLFSQG